jgi:hypothetical protein
MIHPDTRLEFIDETKGFGVVAKRLIPRGTIVWCLDPLDQVISPEHAGRLPEQYQEILNTYAFRDKDGNYVLCWDNSRFVNHSFRPNCLPTPYDVELAVRDIYPGEELVDHYGSLNLETPFRAMPEPGIRRRVAYPHDLPRHHRSWDRQLEQAFRSFSKVEQPLWPFVASNHRDAIADIVVGRKKMASCLETYCPPNKAEPALLDTA